jgi:methanogenic corrinoid protein MtbC1
MIQGLMKSDVPAGNGKRVLLACVQGNHHAVGLQMVADAFQLAGWEAQFLGANVPTHAVIAHLGDYKPHLLALSVSFAQQLHVVKEIMSLLTRADGTARPTAIVGGLGINQFSRLASELGADGWSPDARAAVATAAALPMPAES